MKTTKDEMRKIKYLILDVDGTMTDSGIYYDEKGNEQKRFSTRDGEGIKIARHTGIIVIVLTGRKCFATERRMRELNIDFFEQGVLNKYELVRTYMSERSIKREEVGYIGDDINDLKAMSLAGYIGCPADSCREVKELADYVSPVCGGQGAVRDIIEHILHKSGEWDDVLRKMYQMSES